jgi:hypothetical protein
MASRIFARAREIFIRPLPPERLNLYFALASCVLALAALFYAGRVFELQRRDALLFELERRYQEYQRLLLAADCLAQNGPGSLENSDDVKNLCDVCTRLRAVLWRKREATLDELLGARDDVLTVGSAAAVGLQRNLMNERSKLEADALERLSRSCSM